MVPEIDPTEIDVVENREVRRYDLPVDYEDLLMLDISSQGYTAEWESSLDLPAFESLLQDHVSHHEERLVIASFEPDGAENYSIEGEFKSIAGGDHPYPTDCTYLLMKTPEYDIGWEQWEGANRVMISVPDFDWEILEEYYPESIGDEEEDEQLQQAALNQARSTLQG